jgi:hypothetical protein
LFQFIHCLFVNEENMRTDLKRCEGERCSYSFASTMTRDWPQRQR